MVGGGGGFQKRAPKSTIKHIFLKIRNGITSAVRRRRKSSKKRSVSLPVVVETVERGTFVDAKDEAIEDMKAEQNFSFRLSLGDVTKRTDETQRQESFSNQPFGRFANFHKQENLEP